MKSALRVTPILVFLGTLPALVACSAGSAVPSGRCDPVAARALNGQPKPTDEEAKRRTGVTIVRQIAPGQPVTHDYRDNRVTLETDPTSGRVLGAICG
ncbi:I78 family peptidase inhibitor [Rhizobium sp. Root1220]|uniref:I78 family peptidase inhibitor n=1 Tax=Rhizobium sp. Root1220 TaxID=1736432 RepID=UPI0009EAB4D4|nr:I78 family peptidase inhibitor [Rhizobium sp. Root1220]